MAGTDHKTKTDKDGKYTLKDILPGTQRISVRAVGFAPVDTALSFAADKATENVFFLGKPAVALDTVKTKSQARVAGAGFASFADRKAKGFGAFLDSTFLRANEPSVCRTSRQPEGSPGSAVRAPASWRSRCCVTGAWPRQTQERRVSARCKSSSTAP